MVLNPNCTQSEKETWHDYLKQWSEMEVCPLEDADGRSNHDNSNNNNEHNVNDNVPGRKQSYFLSKHSVCASVELSFL